MSTTKDATRMRHWRRQRQEHVDSMAQTVSELEEQLREQQRQHDALNQREQEVLTALDLCSQRLAGGPVAAAGCTASVGGAAAAAASSSGGATCARAWRPEDLAPLSPRQFGLLRRQQPPPGVAPERWLPTLICQRVGVDVLGQRSVPEHLAYFEGLVNRMARLLLCLDLGPQVTEELTALVVEATAGIMSLFAFGGPAAQQLKLMHSTADLGGKSVEAHARNVALLVARQLRSEQGASLLEAASAAEECLSKASEAHDALLSDITRHGRREPRSGGGAPPPRAALGGGGGGTAAAAAEGHDALAGVAAAVESVAVAAANHARATAAFNLLRLHVASVLAPTQLARWYVYAYPTGPNYLLTLQTLRGMLAAGEAAWGGAPQCV